MLVVGDKHQSIYGFRGAMNGIMDQFVKDKTATLLPLNICYRCSKAVIREAQKYVPEIEACEGAPEGAVGDVSMARFEKEVGAGDFALCRKVAPIVKSCLKLIRMGRQAMVRGRKIGEDLADVLDNLPGREDLTDALNIYRSQKIERLSKSRYADQQIEELNDKVDTLLAITESTENGTLSEVKAKIRDLFSDTLDSEKIIFSSIHKAKGLESDRVYILPSTPVKVTQEWQQEQESNLMYVAITRARLELYYVN